ncbi:hypothetical protein H072_11427 [Dactylellina haptotyla CBS 200.50]|uniref:ShKT domain-containing protein n=1 Tax=Dactylellina haptotyla (strain CBS 200.50) TaxID=1284197 RepID=S8B7X0_DACHA|nr:hypothetical protein H072_11427 [Dactylellina haptotyla CBS 200.50]
MQFSIIAVVATLAAVAQCAPQPVAEPGLIEWLTGEDSVPSWSMSDCRGAVSRSNPNPLTNDWCIKNCQNCVSMKLKCKSRLSKDCKI